MVVFVRHTGFVFPHLEFVVAACQTQKEWFDTRAPKFSGLLRQDRFAKTGRGRARP